MKLEGVHFAAEQVQDAVVRYNYFYNPCTNLWQLGFRKPKHVAVGSVTECHLCSAEITLVFIFYLYYSYSMGIDDSSIERVEEFKYLGTTLTD